MEQRQALAGFALSAVLYALALPLTTPEPELCRDPVEAAAFAQHTSAVRCDAAGPRVRAPARDLLRGPARTLFGLPIELNCAGARTLATLPAIGPVRARRIVAERARRPFERVDELLRVRGIGPKTLEQLRARVAAHPHPRRLGSVDFPGCRFEAVPGPWTGAGGWM